MFDSESEAKKAPVQSDSVDRKRRPDRTVKIIAALIGGLAVILVLAILIVMLGADKEGEGPGGKFFGMQNPNNLSDPDPITAQNIEEEYQARPEMPRETPEMIENSVIKYLSYGDFSGLDSLLKEQMSLYKNTDGDEGQDMDDWRAKFEILRSDIVKTMNLKKDTQPDSTLAKYASPEVLAGAIAWSPVSAKLEAFEDWSSLILPPPSQGEFIDLRAANLSAPHEMLAHINEISAERFYDLTAFDMCISGYGIRLIIVGDQYGYYRPWTIQDLDGVMNRDVWSKRTLKQIRNALDPWTDFDSVLNLAQRENQEESVREREEHPEWFDADGLYIGPDRDISLGGETADIPSGENEVTSGENAVPPAGDDETSVSESSKGAQDADLSGAPDTEQDTEISE